MAKDNKGRPRSSRSRRKKAPDLVAGQVSDNVVQATDESNSVATQQSNEESESMAKENEAPETEEDEISSIIEYEDDVEDQEAPEPLPVGEYEATIKAVTPKRAQTSGKRYAQVDFHVDCDQFPADYPVENNPDGITVPYRMVSLENTPKGRWSMKKFINAIGAKGGKQVDVNEWVGLSAKVKVRHSDGLDGLKREDISAVTAL